MYLTSFRNAILLLQAVTSQMLGIGQEEGIHSRDVGQSVARTSEDRPSHHPVIGGSFLGCVLNYFIDGALTILFYFHFQYLIEKAFYVIRNHCLYGY